MRSPCVFANFVSSVDGVATLGPDFPDAGAVLSLRSDADRFVMGLLRACAQAIVVGAGTLRTTPGHRWTPQDVFPAAADEFANLRRRLGMAAEARLVVVTARGDLDVDHPALRDALVLTGDAGARRLRGRLPAAAELRSLGPVGVLSGAAVLEAVRAEGHETVLTEGGPHLIGELLHARVVDELFLTVSPILAGRAAGTRRAGLVDGLEYEPAGFPRMRLLTLHRHRDHLLLRYGISLPALGAG
jgi:riboflavin biosynthesis pyrimidine reductase